MYYLPTMQYSNGIKKVSKMQLFKDNQLLFFQIIFQQMPVFCSLHGLHMFYLFRKVYGAGGGEQDTVLNVGPVAISD